MRRSASVFLNDIWLVSGVFFLLIFGVISLRAVAGYVFPAYYIYLGVSVFFFLFFSYVDFDILKTFSWFFYFGSILFLILPILVGEITRGAVRWIPVGSLTIQPAEIVRPFLIVFFADYLTKEEITVRRLLRAGVLLSIPLVLILLQPSLGVAALTFVGFVGVMFSLKYNKRVLAAALVVGVLLAPLSWHFMAPYQRLRVMALVDPEADPYGIGYNSIQSKISVGSGQIIGRGLGEGVQTQLAFLPERHTDFIFASMAEEMGFLGAGLLVLAVFYLLYQVVRILAYAKDFTSRAFVSGVFLTLFAQVTIHIGMNMGLFPITGLPLPLVSAGGSSLLGTMIMMGMLVGIKAERT